MAGPDKILIRLRVPWTCLGVALVSALAQAVTKAGEAVGPSPTNHFVQARARMVREFRAADGLTNAAVLAVMERVPRHEFVPPLWRGMAYVDSPLPIGYDQTISQPSLVAYMTQLIEPKRSDRILEIGTGSGYQAAILGQLAAEVYTIEIVTQLAVRAETDLKRLGYTNIHVKAGDGYQGWPGEAPFDSIIVTCAPEQIPPPLIAQLKEGGKMVIPVGPAGDQQLYLLRKTGTNVARRAIVPVRFVPMTGRGGKG